MNRRDCEDKRNLTNYDLFMLKRQSVSPIYEKTMEEVSFTPVRTSKREYADYHSYLMGELCRTAPGRVLTEEEYRRQYSSEREAVREVVRERDYIPDQGCSEKKERKKSTLFQNLFGNMEFKKGGKFLLAIYVIFIVALALILIVTNTSGKNPVEPASASETIKAEQSGGIKAMTLEEEEEDTANWFDALCDSLNK